MIVIRYLVIVIIVFTTNIAWGQFTFTQNSVDRIQFECDTEPDDEYWDYMESTRELRESINLENMRSSSLQRHTIYIAAHILVEDDTDLENEFSTEEVDQSINILNEYFEPVGFTFVRCQDINYVFDQDYPDADIYPEFTRNIESYTAISEYGYLSGFIDVFFVPEIDGAAGFASLPSSSGSLGYVFLETQNDVPFGTAFAHEVGHYFNLRHTYANSTSNDLDKRENVARSGPQANCGNPGVGDELCDTPADPLGTFLYEFTQSSGQQVDVNYFVGRCATDANEQPPCTLYPLEDLQALDECNITDRFGNTYQPPTNNLMGGGIFNCQLIFTDGQIARMQTSLLVDRSHLFSNDCEDCIAFKTFPTGHLHNENTFEIHSVSEDILSRATVKGENLSPGAEAAYTVYNAGESVCLNPSFKAEYGSTFIAYIDGCEPPSPNFKIDGATKISGNFTVYPNPVSTQAVIEYELKSDSGVSFSLFNTTGKKMTDILQMEQKVAGLHQFNFDVTNLPTGIYYCIMQANDHIETQKIVITK